jgi:hypothetical protein
MPFPAFVEVFEVVLASTYWNAAELFCHGCLNGLSVIVLMPFQHSFQSWE